ncbi:MAG: terpene cyclase/mutase family protein [Planctomycetia bacterium]|nr:terpene cyclase/mutase family protein [Planctomycetia bacterium]
MQTKQFIALFAIGCLTVAATRIAAAGDLAVANPEAAQKARRAVERGLVFLEQDAAAWRNERQCATCHHGTMTVWAYMEARSRGYAVNPETVRDTVAWTKERLLERIELPRDTRQGWSMVNTPAIYLATMAQAVPSQDAVSPDDLKRIADHLVRHQESDGAWAWSAAPPKNRPPPFFESDEVATRLAFMALAPHVPPNAADQSPARDSRAKAAAWLKNVELSDTTQAVTLRLLMAVREKESPDYVKSAIGTLLERQGKDGGWGQLKDRESDAYATGQALYVLNLAGVAGDSAEVQRGVAFLVASQKEDGSWPMTRRGHPGVTPSDFKIPITYFGSAWGTLGLMRTVPANK